MSQVSVPFTFTPGTTIASSQVNTNFATLAAAFNTNVDNTNVGPLGFYASQIIPLNSAEATFGSGQSYTFSQGLNVLGGAGIYAPAGLFVGPSSGNQTFVEPNEILVQGPIYGIKFGGSNVAPVPPMYISAGTTVGQGAHSVVGKATISVPVGATNVVYNAGLTSDAAFTKEPFVTMGVIYGPSTNPWIGGYNVGIVQPSVPYTNVGIVVYSEDNAAAISTGTINVYWRADGP